MTLLEKWVGQRIALQLSGELPLITCTLEAEDSEGVIVLDLEINKDDETLRADGPLWYPLRIINGISLACELEESDDATS